MNGTTRTNRNALVVPDILNTGIVNRPVSQPIIRRMVGRMQGIAMQQHMQIINMNDPVKPNRAGYVHSVLRVGYLLIITPPIQIVQPLLPE